MDEVKSALYDNLTGLPNRQCFQDRLKVAISQAKRYKMRFAVMALGLDGFNSINNNLGYSHGDDLLIQVGERLHNSIRESDTVARLGGDEFVLIFHQIVDIKDVNVIAKNCLELFEEPFYINDEKLYINASLGIACYPEDGSCDETLMKSAFKALSKAKIHGKNHFELYNEHMSEDNINYLMLSNDLHRALKEDEFVLHYQPIVDCLSGTVTGVEALIRWQHPTLGLLGPNEFVHIAEKQGLIMQVSDWVMLHACQQCELWHQSLNQDLKISINISAQLFEDPTFIDKINFVIDRTHIPPESISLEITESTIMHDPESAIKTLKKLSQFGINLAVDDFGTGYSSLSYLKNFPVNRLKVDRAFVKDLESDPVNITIIKSILMLAEGLDMQVVIEGVETQVQLDILKGIGAQTIQGYLFSRPLNMEACEKFIQEFKIQSDR